MSDQTQETTDHRVRATSRSLPIALLRARETVMAPIRLMLAGAGVTEQQWRVLRVLAEHGALDPTEIAQKSCLLMPSLTRILKVLEAKGFCSRRPHPTDRRRALIRIAGAGRKLIEDNIPTSNALFADLESQFGKDRIDALLDLLNELSQARIRR